jgi:predicted dehydrogenase
VRILVNNKWQDGFLDYYRSPNEYRIEVRAWRDLEKIEGLYFVRPKNLRLIWNYFKEVGLKSLFIKISSRLQEEARNEKYISCGIGIIVESADESKFKNGEVVGFLSTLGVCSERIVLPENLLFKLDSSDITQLLPDSILYYPVKEGEETNERFWRSLKGWSIYSGIAVSDALKSRVEKEGMELLKKTDWQEAKTLQVGPKTPVQEISETSISRHDTKKKKTVLFGYGNFAKVIILPNVKKYLDVQCIHELDPTQIPINQHTIIRWDTSPMPRPEEKYEVMLIATYHHMHANQAIWALKNNMGVVIEKPIATTESDLANLLEAGRVSKGKIFTGFHKRYLPFNDLVHKDLGIQKGDPFSYHCIVYEVALPKLHWYRWHNSGSRLLTDGCHWIDHFLYLNDFAKPVASDVYVGPEGSINCSIALENNAFFTMALTTQGSNRVGVQDYIEIRANGVTIRMINYSHYIAENKYKILRKEKENKIYCYNAMYQEIARKIFYNLEGESIESLRVSGGITLELEKKMKAINEKS